MKTFKITIFICLIISIISVSKVYAKINNYNLLGKTIYLDPGHGGRDSGAIYQNIYENHIEILKIDSKFLVAVAKIIILLRILLILHLVVHHILI